MLLSSRAQPPRPLKDFSSRPSNSAKSNLSVRQFLLHSPLPSPALPALLPRHGKKPPPFNSRRALRYLMWLAILATVYTVASWLLQWGHESASSHFSAVPYLTSSGKSYQIVVDSQLPEYPTPIGVVDSKSRKKWTISIPDQLGFPLRAADYADICSHIPEVANHISAKAPERTFLDVAEAQKQGLLPPARPDARKSSLSVCKKSLTYVLDATDAGFGSALMGVWISYALAKKEGRAFFIDDTQFAYGRWDTFFRLPPTPPCRPPPASQRLPCPSQARHLVVSAATFPWTFYAEFQSKYSTAETFALAREGYEALFHLRSDDAAYVSQRIAELRGDGPIPRKTIGIHLRRGDRRPFTLAYSQAYLPPSVYIDVATELAHSLTDRTSSHHLSSTASILDSPQLTTILASDDPDLYTSISSISRAQSQIHLASKSTLESHSSKGSSSIGWEGGFFPPLFFSLGLPPEVEWQKRINSPLPSRMVAELGEESRVSRDYRTDPTREALRMRELIGRAYLLDMAVLGGSAREEGGGVVCAVSSVGCRVLGVMVGDRGEDAKGSGGEEEKKGRWVNIEKGYPWRAFDM